MLLLFCVSVPLLPLIMTYSWCVVFNIQFVKADQYEISHSMLKTQEQGNKLERNREKNHQCSSSNLFREIVLDALFVSFQCSHTQIKRKVTTAFSIIYNAC